MSEKVSKKGEFMRHYKSYVSWVKHIGIVTVYGLLFFFLMLNIVFSQDMPPLYFKLVREEDRSLIDFMKQAKNLSVFPYMLPEIRESFKEHEIEIFQEERLRYETITNLEQFLAENPKSTEVLYSLYLLYSKDGNTPQSEEYLRRAQALDPKLGR